VKIDDRPLGADGNGAPDEEEHGCEQHANDHDFGFRRAASTASHVRQVAAPNARKPAHVDEQAAGGTPTSTRCRFCGSERGESEARAVREKSHVAVVVACGSCGHPFAVLSRN